MSGRPLDPTVTVPSWATETNYPAGSNPWNGQPLKVLPPADYFTPGVPAPAEYFNYQFNLVGSSFSSLQGAATSTLDYLGQTPAQNWHLKGSTEVANATYFPSGTSDVLFTDVSFLNIGGVTALIAGMTSTANTTQNVAVVMSPAKSGVWTILGSLSVAPSSHQMTNVVAAPDGSYVVALCANENDGTHIVVETSLKANYSASNSFAQISTGVAGTTIAWSFAEQLTGSSVIVSGDNKVFTSTNGTSWTDRSAAFSGTSSSNSLLFASSGSGYLIISQTSLGTGSILSYSSPDGLTWTVHTTNNNSLDYIWDLAWDSARQVWVALMTDSSSDPMFVRTSADGITWTTPGTGLATALGSMTVSKFRAGGLDCVGGMWVVSAPVIGFPNPDAGSTYGDGSSAVFYSTDGGVTFNISPELSLDAVSSGQTRVKVGNKGVVVQTQKQIALGFKTS